MIKEVKITYGKVKSSKEIKPSEEVKPEEEKNKKKK